jgi:hypothetical protein
MATLMLPYGTGIGVGFCGGAGLMFGGVKDGMAKVK